MKYQHLFIFLCAGFVLLFNGLVYIKNRSSKVNQAFAIFGIFMFVWLFSYGIAYATYDLHKKMLFFRIGYAGIIGMPLSFFIFVSELLGKRQPLLLRAGKILTLCFLIAHFTKFSLVIGMYNYSWGYYPNTNIFIHKLFLLFLFSFFSLANYSLAAYLLSNPSENKIIRLRVKYVLLGSIVGNLSMVDFLANYGFSFPPIGFIFIFIYPFIFSYAILKYRLMDVSIAITRTSIFLLVYSLVLGLPFAVAFGLRSYLFKIFGESWWIFPLTLSTVLATLGPYIYAYMQKRAEDKLLQEQRQYQSTLRQASLGMGKIKDLRRLLQLIVNIVTRVVKIEHSEIFLYHEDSKNFILKASKSRSIVPEPNSIVASNSILISYLKKIKEPIVAEEIKQRNQDFNDPILKDLDQVLESLKAALVVPSFIEQRLIAVIVLGKKTSGKLYSQDDLVVFSILANQAALAIENAQFYEDMKKTHEQLFKAEKMATIGTMADGLSHQINNRLHAMGFIAGDAIDSIRLKKDNLKPEETKELLKELEDALAKIQDNVKRGGEIVGGLLKYTRKGEEGFAPVDLGQLLTASYEMAQFKIKANRIKLVREFTSDIPKIHGNFTQLQEVFFNLIDNAYDAMMQRKEELKENNYDPALRIQAIKRGKKLEICLQDNGIGVKKENMDKIFTPFFTTKLSSKKGTGLGMYVIRQIIEENHGGSVQFRSEYGVGSETVILLPIEATALS